MIPWTLADIDKAMRASWAADTCSPDDLSRAGWHSANPSWGHCDITALVVNDIFGGDLIVGEVHLNGEQVGYHWWNRLASGAEVDLTLEQFQLGQVVSAARVVQRPPGPLLRRWEEYELLRARLADRLGPLPEPAGGTDAPAPAS
ncbi:YunG family protein [Streptomyces sp. NPDC059717]|uniref:YunG family protein n=1 Tax=Streptomyces sp. NPDC059717 TaxID=3346922 RepID=UPI0036C9AED4